MSLLNQTHSPELTSWISSANRDSDFPIQNLPFAIFRLAESGEAFRGGVAIGDQILDIAALAKTNLCNGSALKAAEAASESSLNRFMGLAPEICSALRSTLSQILSVDAPEDTRQKVRPCLVPMDQVEFDLPCRIGDYTDFYSSINHATSVGKLFRPDQPLLPNYKWVPIGYHGRSSSIGISGQEFHRPIGQRKSAQREGDQRTPEFGPSQRLDYELELGILVGRGTELGQRVDIEQAEQHIFGFCLFNDWSARDIQAWEYQPLGPFLGKNFASTMSPWVISLEALAPFRTGFSHPDGDPQPLPYLSSPDNSKKGALDIQMEVYIQTQAMRAKGEEPERIAGSNFKDSYWTAAQLLTHQSVGGCNLNSGDLLGSGTQSGEKPEEAGSLLELSEGGKKPFKLVNGEQRVFLEDGDRVTLRAYCAAKNAVRIGFGEASGTLLPAR